MKKQLIIHIPHSSSHIPFNDGYVCDGESLENEIMLLTDWFTDDLFHSDKDIMVVSDFSRVFCDVERFADDAEEPMAAFGMGAVYTHLDNGKPMRIVSSRLRKHIMKEYYQRHHEKLTNAVASQIEIAGSALILDGHSFPDQPFRRDLDQADNRPDICIGTDEFHTPKELIDCSIDYFTGLGYSVSINSPYSGSLVPMRFFRKDKRVSSIMLEINRRLYLKGKGNQKSEGYGEMKGLIGGYVDLLRRSISEKKNSLRLTYA